MRKTAGERRTEVEAEELSILSPVVPAMQTNKIGVMSVLPFAGCKSETLPWLKNILFCFTTVVVYSELC